MELCGELKFLLICLDEHLEGVKSRRTKFSSGLQGNPNIF